MFYLNPLDHCVCLCFRRYVALLSQLNNSMKRGSTKEVFLASHAIGMYIYCPYSDKVVQANTIVL
jgi:hypothetical protein